MGSFPCHVLPGTLFLAVGIWHIWSAIVRYVSNPESFRVKSWNPIPGIDGKLRNLEIYVITIGSFIDLCVELLYATQLKFFVNGILNPVHMNNFEHSGMLVMFFIFGLIALLSQETRFLPLPDEALCLIAATTFTAEYFLFYFHSTNHKGLEGFYHLLLVVLIGLCIISTVSVAFIPTKGCSLNGDSIVCKSPDDQVRGELLANFQLFSLVFGVFVGVVGFYGFAASRYGHSDLKRLVRVDRFDRE
ncbi:hypothetical protein MKW94_009760 [Papaver nudicaule]|uniref:Transmembrane protein 45B n=1 Tax=Papaver nudicaule TaxID=74823 RepID=A0AA42ASN7_PAPNU|nr:hypothetical protein [Papaver nudicaule]